MKTLCEICKKEFKIAPYMIKKGYGRFCSRKCWGSFLLGKKLSPEIRKKLSISHLGQKAWNKGLKGVQVGYWKGKRMSYKIRKIFSKAHGGKNWTPNKYRFALGGKKQQLEHRAMAEKCLGRPLKPTEDIHHINKIKTDNRLENLYIFPSRSEHMKYHQALKKGLIGLLKSNLSSQKN